MCLHAQVIQALSNKSHGKGQKDVVPFRESKLTQMLEESLGGTALCAMLACISPAEHSVTQTLSTLKYAEVSQPPHARVLPPLAFSKLQGFKLAPKLACALPAERSVRQRL